MIDDPSALWSRRGVIGAAAAAAVLPTRALSAAPETLFAGTYAAEGGAGLVPLSAASSGWTPGVARAATRNASFGVRSRARTLRYLVDEQTAGSLRIYDAAWRHRASVSTLGADPCHVALSPDGGMLAAANYSSGSVATWRLDRATGLPRGEAMVVRHEGHGPNTARQAGPHAHWVGFTADGAVLHSVDLGADSVFAHRIDRAGGRIADTGIAYQAASGSGPRHLTRHPHRPVAYLVAELANTVTVLRSLRDGRLVERAVHSTLPPGFRGESFAAHIAIDASGQRLYVSNRGHDSVAVFAIDALGALTPLQHVASGGHWPRYFRLMETRGEMLVANERSGGIARLPLRPDGTLGTAAEALRLPGVVFLID
ncbi:lactonase family protein [Sphingomonas sp. GV3]|uniref:lactonase family protein n=1 Tax=Sphingomonas sp. GV3 TaxID=3040671 RepID=UPI00280B48EA|nr:lactonase family protein [Sphingomonas sp. GV3]